MRGKVAVAALMLLAGCTMTLPVTGQIRSTGETFSGSATGHMDGAGNLTIVSNRGATCRGGFVYATPREGAGTFTCDDGRTGPFQFISTGKRGTGTGDLDGQPLIFTFGKL